MQFLPLSSIVISPLIAIPVVYSLMKFIFYLVRNSDLSVEEKFRKGAIISSAAFAFSHGANDAQKTIGIICLFLLSAGMLQLSPSVIIYPPLWVIVLCSLAIAFGTATGAWRIIKT
ncbi:putative low-affinity inorganic phosphate transporter (fragment) [groundwater metagenome]